MANGIEINEHTFQSLKPSEQMSAIFKAIVTTNENLCQQPAICEEKMDNKIKAERKRRGRINIGLGSGGGIGAFGILEFIKSLWNS